MSSKPATKSHSRPSLADRLAAVAGPPPQPAAVIEREAKNVVAATALQAPRVKPQAVAKPAPAPVPASTAKAREGKVMIAGYFSPQMAKAVKLLAVERDITVQALIGEALDMVLHKNGKHPMGER
jgi:hypothetical protein